MISQGGSRAAAVQPITGEYQNDLGPVLICKYLLFHLLTVVTYPGQFDVGRQEPDGQDV